MAGEMLNTVAAVSSAIVGVAQFAKALLGAT
jgi:hypothetical protein